MIATPIIPAGNGPPVEIRVNVGGLPVRTLQMASGQPQEIRVVWAPRGLAFIELEAADISGAPAEVHVRVERR